jgi:hypothetical protein
LLLSPVARSAYLSRRLYYLPPTQISQRGQSLILAVRRAILDQDIAAFGTSSFAKALAEWFY